MSQYIEKFNGNIARVDNLNSLFEHIKKTKKRPTVKEADILRASVVFLHSALEDYLRAILSERIPMVEKAKILDGISLPDNEGRAEKFTLGNLLPYRDQTIDSLIRESVTLHMKKVSFNDTNDICMWLKKIDLEVSGFTQFDKLGTMINRRHKIVHEADTNPQPGRGYHRATAINLGTVKAWRDAVVSFVSYIDEQL